MKTKSFNRLIAWVLLAGAVAFALLLAGVGSELLMHPASYIPPR